MNQRGRMLGWMLPLLLLGSVACGLTGGQSGDSEALQQQVYALETQNALLQADADAGSQDAGPDVQPPDGEQEIPAGEPDVPAAEPQIVVASPTPEALPSGLIPAGQAIIYDGWSLTVSREIEIDTYDDNWGPTLYLRNLGDSERVFRFTNAGVTARDDLGNVYPPGGHRDCEEVYNQVKNLSVRGGDMETIQSSDYPHSVPAQPGCGEPDAIQMFDGMIPLEASSLILHFEQFGPFDGVDVVIDL